MTTPSSSPISKEFTILMASLMSIVAISIDAMLPALGAIGAELQVSKPNHAQYIISMLFLGMAVGELVCGPLSDALGRKRILYGTVGLYFAGSVLCCLADSLELMLIGRFIQGLGVAGPYVSTMSIIRDKYHGREMARVMSLVMMIFIMVPAIAPTLGQGILLVGHWRHIFMLYIVYSLAIMVWTYFRLEETLPPQERIPFRLNDVVRGFLEVITNRMTFCYTLCMGFLFGSFIGYLNSAQQIFQVQFQTGDAFTLYFGGLALVFGAASMLNARLVERLGMRFLCKRALATIIGISGVFLAVQQLVDIQLWMLLAYVSVLFFCTGLLFGNLNALAMEPMGHIAGIAAAVIGFVSSLISMSFGTLIGQLYDNTLLPLTAGFLIMGTLALLFFLSADRKQPAIA